MPALRHPVDGRLAREHVVHPDLAVRSRLPRCDLLRDAHNDKENRTERRDHHRLHRQRDLRARGVDRRRSHELGCESEAENAAVAEGDEELAPTEAATSYFSVAASQRVTSVPRNRRKKFLRPHRSQRWGFLIFYFVLFLLYTSS